ncbi:phosphomannomutase [Microvirga tunisiensis]|uniref:Phosphomannomutase n=1 Tax=Microvirga tunisiensis TaxID=2108360 RepID=A0A5N7MJ38_9HYPH|nr:phosphomannomutase [Microvirga tunisiensis]MPR08708.1 phosphomannomutase [Microvirga tunisiensis]MPR26913.1 phosphomannomutase [Microvirga tunisiensis]
MASSLKFGTSGLRGLVTELNGVPAFAYTRAFAEMLKEDGSAVAANGVVLVGRDLRDSSPSIAQLCCAALKESGLAPLDCGALPTPALAYHGMRFGLPAVMVTGSHIPEDRNGLKFYCAKGEIDKQDETQILAWHGKLDIQAVPDQARNLQAGTPEIDLLAAYKARYQEFFGAGAMAGLTVGVYQHSSVARDVIVEMIEALGARAVPLGRATSFIPVDTEALREEDEILAQQWAGEQRLDAIVSTDGDADRPLISDGTGAFLRGDLVGAITARALGADVIVTPVTSNSALEASGAFGRVVRTRVGSPYVIEGMAEAGRSGARAIVGFEANGGVLLGSDILRGDRQLAALPTRDAMLPILCALHEIVANRKPLQEIGREFAFKAAASNRLKEVATEKSVAFVSRLELDEIFMAKILAPLGGVAEHDHRDGLRITAKNGEVVHFRPSGNAPELRVYVEAATPERAESLLSWGLQIAAQHTR